MKAFLKKLFLKFILPILLVMILTILWDPFKVFFHYDDYYKDTRIAGNREFVCFRLFERNTNKENLRNFIIGNSRSQAYKTDIWAKYLNVNKSTCFHYDGSGMSVYRVANSLDYLCKNTKNINHVLIVIDIYSFSEISNPEAHLFTQSPAISKESNLAFYSKFIKANLDPVFLFYNSIFHLTGGTYFKFMKYHITSSDVTNKSDNNTGDIFYPQDIEISKDSMAYYKKQFDAKVFFDRPENEVESQSVINGDQKIILQKISKLVKNYKINCKIVISPLYNQRKMNQSDLFYLKNNFGYNNVHDFSGKNTLTQSPMNYYEDSHYKPYIANSIMKTIYVDSNYLKK